MPRFDSRVNASIAESRRLAHPADLSPSPPLSRAEELAIHVTARTWGVSCDTVCAALAARGAPRYVRQDRLSP